MSNVFWTRLMFPVDKDKQDSEWYSYDIVTTRNTEYEPKWGYFSKFPNKDNCLNGVSKGS